MSAEQSPASLTPLQAAVHLLKQTQARLAACEEAQFEPIAIIGMGCRFPGQSDNPAAFWRLLRDGKDAIVEVPRQRWNIDDYYDPDPSVPNRMNTRWGGFLDKVDEFDAEFFGISPREAIRVDPQHRLLLEVAWEALEDAGLPPTRLARTQAGVYVGVLGSDYALFQFKDPGDMDIFSGTAISHSILANRLSYFLNLNGPSVTLDTACSSALVAVHLACQSLRRRESDLALAAGVNLVLSPEATVALTKAHMMAPDGRCKAFDAAADGYVRGEGCGVVVLKRLSAAKADGDRILGVIRGTAVNHDGRSNGLSAPNGPAQEALIRAALADANVQPRDIGYIEAHGTGTRLGDPIEIDALRTVLGDGRSRDERLLVGSVKTNIGHLESAAGIAGLIKVVLMLQHGQVPPHLHLKNVNPLLRLDGSPLEIPTRMTAWSAGSRTRLAGVSAFGFGGTNAHAVVEEAPAEPSPCCEVRRPANLFVLSARSPAALAELAARYADATELADDDSLADMAYTAATGRVHFDCRAAVVASSVPEIRERLRSFADDPRATGVHTSCRERPQPPRIAFLFTGQGAQYAGMGKTLYRTQPTFRTAIDACDEQLRPRLGCSLLTLLEPDSGTLLDRTGYTQPVLFALEYALACLWRSWGIEPVAVMGHSVGEFPAACFAGVLSLEEGSALIAERARLMQALPSGGLMAAVFATPERVATQVEKVADRVSVAAWNGPLNVVISGDEDAVRQLMAEFEKDGIKSKPLATSHAFHSHRLESMLGDLSRFASGLRFNAPKINLVSNLTGRLADVSTYADPDYWIRHARSPVNFADSMRALADLGCDVFLEIGPSPVLTGMGSRCLPGGDFAWLPSLRPGRDEWQVILDSLAELYVRGAAIDWAGFDRDYPRRRVALPTYPFQRRRYWLRFADEAASQGVLSPNRGGRILHPLLGRRVVTASIDSIFEAQLAADRPAVLQDHKIQGQVIMPGAGYLEMVLAASAAVHGQPWELCGATLVEPLLLDRSPKTVQTILSPDGPGSATFRIVSITESEGQAEPTFVTLATGRLESPHSPASSPLDVTAERARFTGPSFDTQWQSEALRKSGVEPGPAFLWFVQHWVSGDEGLAEVRAARDADRVSEYQVHPGLLDSMFQLLGGLLPGAGSGIDGHVPVGVDRIEYLQSTRQAAWCRASLKSNSGGFVVGDVQLLDESGLPLLRIEGLRLRRVPRDWLTRRVSGPLRDWTYDLAWLPQSPEASLTLSEPVDWLILDSRDGLGAALAERLDIKGHRAMIIPAGVDAQQRDRQIQEFAAEPGTGQRGLVFLSGLDVGDSLSTPDFQAAEQSGWGSVLDIVHSLAAARAGDPPRLWLVTRGAQAVGHHPHPLALSQSPIWGMARVIAAEHPRLACTRIDLDPDRHSDEPDQLAEELCLGLREDQVSYRGGERFVARLLPTKGREAGALPLPEGQPYRLEITARGQLDNVVLRGVSRPRPDPGQVEIRVRATGMNFRDVLNVLNLYPGDPGPLGGECAGEITAVGAGVDRFKPGDQVVALAPASFASYALTLAEFVVPKPDHLSFEEAATIPICFLTAELALRRLGRMQRGQRVLIHAATGGVGLASIQIARQIGVEVFATAGNDRKREYLRAMGIEHVMDSRSLEFADQIRRATGGAGVDLVVNSLTGEAIEAGLSVVNPGGRFMELGKTDLWDQERVDRFRPGVEFHAIALDRMMAEEPETVGSLIREVLPQFAPGGLEPLPLRTFRVDHVVDALRQMARTEHIGKVIIRAVSHDAADRGVTLADDATYLVTGGLGGIGVGVVRWLAEHGARHLALVGRSEPSAASFERIDALRQAGVNVQYFACDVANRDSVAELLAGLRENSPPLRGVFHLAGVLDDGVLSELNRERFDRVMRPKAMGAWHLHDLTRGDSLDYFVLFSSAAAVLGSPGQANYAAANAFLDALAQHRHWQQRPALSVNWGAWAETGMASRLSESEIRRLAAAGVDGIDPDQGVRTLEKLLTEDRVQAAVLPMDWAKFFERIPAGSEPPWSLELARTARAVHRRSDAGSDLLDRLREVTPAERMDVALTFVRQQAARVLAIDEVNLPDPRRTLNELGFDSLTGVEFSNRIGTAIGQQLNPSLLFDHPTLEGLTRYVVRDALQLECDATATPADGDDVEDEFRVQAAADVEDMSEEDMDALVSRQLQQLQSSGPFDGSG